MKTIKIKPVQIIGQCRAGLTVDDECQIKGMNLAAVGRSKLCFLALGHFAPIVAQLQSGKRFYAHLACPDCLSRRDQENGVEFLLGHADKWALCRAISDYYHLSGLGPESEAAKQLKAEARQLQTAGSYGPATQKMVQAVAELKRAVAL